MAKIAQIDVNVRQRKKHGSVDLAVSPEAEIFSGVDLRNLIDSWIIPKMVDDWIGQLDRNPETVANKG